MELFTELAKHPGDLATLQGRLGLHPRAARGFPRCPRGAWVSAAGRTASTATPRIPTLFLDKAKPSYIGGMLEMANHRLYPFWGSLTTALRTGEPQNESKGGQDLFAALYADPARLREFLRAMSGVSRGANMAIARSFRGRTTRPAPTSAPPRATSSRRSPSPIRICTASASICRKSARSLKNTLRPTGCPTGSASPAAVFSPMTCPKPMCSSWATSCTTGTCRPKQMLLGKAYAALPAGGAVIVYEAIIDDDRQQNAFGLLMSLNMLIETPGRLRLHRAPTASAGCASRLQRLPRRASDRARFDGDRDQITSCPPHANSNHSHP